MHVTGSARRNKQRISINIKCAVFSFSNRPCRFSCLRLSTPYGYVGHRGADRGNKINLHKRQKMSGRGLEEEKGEREAFSRRS